MAKRKTFLEQAGWAVIEYPADFPPRVSTTGDGSYIFFGHRSQSMARDLARAWNAGEEGEPCPTRFRAEQVMVTRRPPKRKRR